MTGITAADTTDLARPARRMTQDSEQHTVIIVENPQAGAAGGVELVDRLEQQLAGLGLAVERASDPEIIRRRLVDSDSGSTEAGSQRPACVVCCGGDGTVAMVANWASPTTPLAVLPLGTENLLAKQLGFDRNIDRLCQRIAGGHTRSLDAGEANGRLFLVVASVGFDAEVVRLVAARRTGNIHHSTWVRPILQALGSYRYPEIQLTTDTNPRPIRTRWAFVFNLPRYALGLRFVAEGDSTDGRLDLCCFRGGRWWSGLRYLAGVMAGWHRSWRDTHIEQATRITITAAEPVPYQIDGDPGGELPLEIRVLPGRLRFVTDPSPTP
jgi:diacylglycerol kinase (ATP)